MSNMPAICQELKLRADGTIALVNSRDVAALFDKEHKNVLRDIDAILHGSDLSRVDVGWFREIRSEHTTVAGRFDRSFDLTRDGFMLLVMGWTGERAMAFKVRYIQAFNAMEAELKQGVPEVANLIISGLKEALAPLAVRFDGQDRAIERVEGKVDGLAADVAQLKYRLGNGRRNLTAATKRDHIETIKVLGSRCPCCGTASILIDDMKSRFSEFDHFYQNSQPNAEHTWLICAPCHTELSCGRVPRHQREAVFRAYQDQRRRLPGRQPGLFD